MNAGYLRPDGRFHRVVCAAAFGARVRCFFIALILAGFGLTSTRGDGCFVFKWNKAVDINEPTQKAIIFHDAGREDLLLQVKYEGAVEDFGWLIPTPNLPEVLEGSMEPFYELSKLTQRHFGSDEGNTHGRGMMTMSANGAPEDVKVIQIKTVGAYEVSVLSTKDAGALKRWLKAHDYSFPEGKSEILDEYIQKGWYFVAAKIELNKGLSFRKAPVNSPKETPSPGEVRTKLQAKLSSGELHPLLISFDTPRAVFPLKISAAGGKPSAVSIYTISEKPLLSRFLYDQAVAKLVPEYTKWESEKSKRLEERRKSQEYSMTFRYRSVLDSFYAKKAGYPIPDNLRDYTQEDLLALAREEKTSYPAENLGEYFYGAPENLLRSLKVATEELPQCAKSFSRMNKRDWYLTKLVQTFTPPEMRDLDFESAFPVLSGTLSQPVGSATAQALAQLGTEGQACLSRACSSTNYTERFNALIGIENSRQPVSGNALVAIFKDPSPVMRIHALNAAEASPESRYVDGIVALLRDPVSEVRREACSYLLQHEPAGRTQFYLGLAQDADPNVRGSAISIAGWINRYAPSDEVFQVALRLLKDRDEEVRNGALGAIYKMRNKKEVPREDILPFLNSPDVAVHGMASQILRSGSAGPSRPGPRAPLSTPEILPLLTNHMTIWRLHGLSNLRRKGDAESVELIFPLLSDTNKLLRNRAFFVLRELTGADVPENDPTKLRAWWNANKSSFHPKQATEENRN